MRLVMNGVKCSALLGLLGVSVWAIGCGETTSPPKANGTGSIAPAKTNGEAGSSLGGGVDVPPDKAGGTVDPAGFTKPADPDAKPADDPADSTEDKKTEGADESK